MRIASDPSIDAVTTPVEHTALLEKLACEASAQAARILQDLGSRGDE
ncbi:MAG: hypothetical protein OXG43_05015 [Chloroflexi bacterium]|nr:hypothetical protein [Chloroflexota bacterium]